MQLQRIYLAVIGVLAFFMFGFPTTSHSQTKKIVLEDFSADTLGGLPARWFNRNGSISTSDLEGQDRLLFKYVVAEEDSNKYLAYEGIAAKHLMYPIKDLNFELKKEPEFSWKWRAHVLAEDSDVYDNEANDAVLSVYVVFGVNFFNIPRVIRYVWGNSRAKGNHYSLNFGNQKLLVLRDRTDSLGHWYTEKRNLLEDYKTFFSGRPPKAPLAILILSDGNDTKQMVKGDYDEFLMEVKND